MLFGIPFSLIGSIFGAITGWLTKRSAMASEVQAGERKFQLEAMVAVTKANHTAVKDEIALLNAKAEFEKVVSKADPHRSIARRVIAYTLVAALAFGVPAMVLIVPSLQWFQINEFTKSSSGFFGIGAYSKQVFEVITSVGLPLVWLESISAVVSTIVGFYFGGSAAKFKNPYINK